MTRERFDVAVVGAGAAGLAAASECARAGLSTVLFDEQSQPGGQIYRAITTTPLADHAILGDDYWHGAQLVQDFERSGATYRPRSCVWAVTREEPGYEIAFSSDGMAQLVDVRHVIVATGAMERPFPVPGWTLPGVMMAGAAQVLLKSSGLVPDGPAVLAGTGPLLYLLAAQLARVGAKVGCILDTTPHGRLRAVLPHAAAFAASPYFAKGLAILRDAHKATRIVRHVERIEAVGAQKVERVRYAVGGRVDEMPVDVLLLHQGVIPNINLPNAIGCAQRWDDAQVAFVPVVDAWGATSVPGVSIAGDAAGIGGARAAEARGTLAAMNVACALGRIQPVERDRRSASARRDLVRYARGRSFVDALYRPAAAFRLPAGNTIVCRCEEVTAAQIVDTVRLGCVGPNQMKSFLRCGMGPCQGRFCGTTVTELIARERGVAPDEVGYYRLRFPVKPITLGELAALPQTAASMQAVVRLGKSH
jgi:octopine oxidase subunit A